MIDVIIPCLFMIIVIIPCLFVINVIIPCLNQTILFSTGLPDVFLSNFSFYFGVKAKPSASILICSHTSHGSKFCLSAIPLFGRQTTCLYLSVGHTIVTISSSNHAQHTLNQHIIPSTL